MMYADWAQGFRPGGSNSGLPGSPVPPKWLLRTDGPERPVCRPLTRPIPSTTTRLGWKTTSLENRLLWNGAAYYMDWKDLQALIYNALVCSTSSYNINVGQARIYGAESNIDYRLTDNLTLQASVNYTQASVTSTVTPDYQTYVGERLPFAPYFSWSWNARYEHPLAGEPARLPAVRHGPQGRHVQRPESQ